jgi:integrase
MMKYVIRKKLKDGKLAFYWNPPRAAKADGLTAEALGSDQRAAFARATKLNLLLDEVRGGKSLPQKKSVSHLIRRYLSDERFTCLRPSTQRVYLQAVRSIEEVFGPYEPAAVTKRHARMFYQRMRQPKLVGGRERAAVACNTIRVARVLWEHFCTEGIIETNPFRAVVIKGPGKRSVFWTADQVLMLASTADRLEQPGIATAVLLAFETCQRQGDILALKWHHVGPKDIRLVQNKTGAHVILPTVDLPAVRARLDRMRVEH